MRQYFISSALLHFLILGPLIYFALHVGPSVIWLEGPGFDYGGGGGGGDGKKGGGLKEKQRGQPVPQPVKAVVPDKPAPAQKATRGQEVLKVKGAKEEATQTKSTSKKIPDYAPVGDKAQEEKSNVIRRGVADGEQISDGGFDFGDGSGSGSGMPIGIGFGPGGGGAGFGGYLSIMRKRIWREWTQYTIIGSDKSCVLGLTVSRNGQVTKVLLEQSSGDPFFDNVARRAVRNASPLPPFPPAFPRSSQKFRIKFKLIE